MTRHGIAIRDKKTRELLDFKECEVGRKALAALRYYRTQGDTHRYTFDEEVIE